MPMPPIGVVALGVATKSPPGDAQVVVGDERRSQLASPDELAIPACVGTVDEACQIIAASLANFNGNGEAEG